MDVDWFAFPGPKWYQPGQAARAARDLTAPDGAALAVGRLAGAVGNDHAGTLYPAAVPAVGVLLEVIRDQPGARRIDALWVLIDWWGSFEPEPGCARYHGDDGHEVDLIEALERQIRDAAGMLRTLADDWTDGSPARKLAKDLLALLDEGGWNDR